MNRCHRVFEVSDLRPALEFIVVANVPLPWVAGGDPDHPFITVKCIRDIHLKMLPVVLVLDRPTVVVLFKSPLQR